VPPSARPPETRLNGSVTLCVFDRGRSAPAPWVDLLTRGASLTPAVRRQLSIIAERSSAIGARRDVGGAASNADWLAFCVPKVRVDHRLTARRQFGSVAVGALDKCCRSCCVSKLARG